MLARSKVCHNEGLMRSLQEVIKRRLEGTIPMRGFRWFIIHMPGVWHMARSPLRNLTWNNLLECACHTSSSFITPPAVIRDQDQDSLLVKRRNNNHSPGPVIRELVPNSHKRSELSNTILCIFSRWDQRIGEGILIPDSLGEEATFINICISNRSLKCHRVLISTTPSFGDKVICWYTGFTFKTFI